MVLMGTLAPAFLSLLIFISQAGPPPTSLGLLPSKGLSSGPP